MQKVTRLITHFTPEHYQLSLDIQRTARTFSGTVTMNGRSATMVETILLHAKGLTIQSVTVNGNPAKFRARKNDEIVISHPDITPGRHVVVTTFTGTITDAMHGMYPCYYQHDGVKKELLATQFESHHAREVFPCIDEPEAKATFDVTLTTEPDVTVLGNMPVKTQRHIDDKLVTTFDTTPRMSTYLLAWAIGELHRKTAVTKRGVEVSVYATPAQPADSLDFALDFAARTIDFFEEYFGIDYPLPKSDHIALPDFTSGAMENWGLITYREIALLADPRTAGASTKHYVATVIAHELSHQWFGNLVTMRWWNNLWLNESFATLMEYVAVDALQPDWNMWLEFATTESIAALRRDSLDGVQSVQTDVHHPDEIGTLFDGAIVYAKGARLMRMLQQYIGPDAFRAGLQAYFSAHAYGNTEGDDLWQALAQTSGKDIGAFMNAWISQSGYPVVSVAENDGQLNLSQQQFFVGPHQPSEKLWPIPLNASAPDFPQLLETRSQQVSVAPGRLNVGDSAHFITHYSDDLLAAITEQIRSGELSPLDRLQLLDEQTLLARGGVISTAQLIPLLDAYKNEGTESVWDIISMTIGELKKFVETDETAEKQLRALAGLLARQQYQRLGWTAQPGEPETDAKLRATILGCMVYSQDPDVLAQAIELYKTVPVAQLDPELRALILGTAVRYGQPEYVDTLLEHYAATQSADLQQDIACGLTSTRDPAAIRRLLGLIQDSSVVRPQDVRRWFMWLLRNRDGRELTWQWLRDNWKWVAKKFEGDKSYDAFPRFCAGALVTRQQLAEYTEFFTPLQKKPALTRTITIGIGEIAGRVELIERDSAAVRDALTKL